MVQVGFGKAAITPPLGTLCAFGLDDEAEEIFDPVFVRATVLGDGNTTIYRQEQSQRIAGLTPYARRAVALG